MIGKVETGVVNQGDRVKLMPTGMLTTVLNLYSNEQAVRQVGHPLPSIDSPCRASVPIACFLPEPVTTGL